MDSSKDNPVAVSLDENLPTVVLDNIHPSVSLYYLKYFIQQFCGDINIVNFSFHIEGLTDMTDYTQLIQKCPAASGLVQVIFKLNPDEERIILINILERRQVEPQEEEDPPEEWFSVFEITTDEESSSS